jgi:hypothetical protein
MLVNLHSNIVLNILKQNKASHISFYQLFLIFVNFQQNQYCLQLSNLLVHNHISCFYFSIIPTPIICTNKNHQKYPCCHFFLITLSSFLISQQFLTLLILVTVAQLSLLILSLPQATTFKTP